MGGTSNASAEGWIWDKTNGMRLITELLQENGLPISTDGYLPTFIWGLSGNGKILVGEGTKLVNSEKWAAITARGLWLDLPNLP